MALSPVLERLKMKHHDDQRILTKVFDKTISVDAPKTIESLLAKYSYVSDVYKTEKELKKPGPYTAHYSVWELLQSATADQIARALAEQNMRPATGQELLCFANAYPEACDPPLIATGSAEHVGGRAGVPVITIQPGGVSRAGELFVDRFATGTHVLSMEIERKS